MSKDNKSNQVTASGVAMYASVHTPRKAFTPGDPPAYQMDLIVDSETEAKLKAAGLKPAKKMVDEDTKVAKSYPEFPGMAVFSLKKKTVKADGTPNAPVKVVDTDLNPVPHSVLIGNGSKVTVDLNVFTIKVKGRDITGAVLMGVQVDELVEFAERNNFKPKPTGFKMKAHSKTLSSMDSQDAEGEESPFEDE